MNFAKMERRMKSEELFVLTEGEELFRTELKNRLARDKKFQDIINRTLLIKDFDRQLFWEAFNFFKNAGYSAYGIPEEYGGFPASSRGSVILTEELCALDASIGLSLGATISLVASPILHWGTEEQKKFWLPKIVAGEVLGCYCQTEPNSGSDVASIQGRAVLRNGVWHITKSSRFITNGTEANLALVLVRTASRQEDVHYGLTMFIVDLERAKRERQASTPRNEVKAGLHLSPTSEVIFDDCVADDILGELHHGWAVAMSTLVGSRATSIAAQGIGVGRAAWELARDYAIGRMQFGLKLEEIPQQRKRLQKMETAVHMARLLAWRSAMLRDEKGARDSRPWECEASQAKLFSSEMAEWAPSEAMQLMGGVGYIMEAKAAKFWHDGRIVKIYEGTSDIQCTIIMHRLLERFGKELTWLAAPRISAVTRWPHARRLAVVWPVSKDEEEEMNRELAQNLKKITK